MKSTIRLFKAVLIQKKLKKKASKELLEKTIKKGFVFSPEVIANYTEKELINMISIVEEEIGITAEQINNSFHKSWNKIKTASIEQLVLEQVMHYITTYGFEHLGIYSKDTIFIPNEELNIPKLEEGITLISIKGYTEKELREKILDLLTSGIALKEDTINDIMDACQYISLTDEEVFTVKNKEVKIRLYEKLGIFPKNPVEFLRYLIYFSIDSSLIIKSPTLISKIKGKENIEVLALLVKYKKKYGLENLSTIFYRYKPIFLAFRGHKQLNAIINKIRKLAKKNHKPMKEDYLNEITSMIKRGHKIDKGSLESELSTVNIFRKIRLAYALKFRTTDADSIVYRIRNGKGFATDFNFHEHKKAKEVYDIVIDNIVKDIKKNVNGKKIFIPEHVTYTLPATEKQFIGDFPSGSYITIPKDLILGVYWTDQNGERIDLDLSLINTTNGKIGWDGHYRSENAEVLFSGDITAAPKPNGASELFYIKRQVANDYILCLNYFNYDADIPVPFKIVLASEKVSNLKENYMVNPNNIVALVKSKIDKQQKILGLLTTTTKECKFYFAEADIGVSITSGNDDMLEKARKYLFNFYKNTINLNDVIVKAGGKLVKDKEDCDIDLSIESLEKDKILQLLKEE